jgi:Tol biopolymer transport system component
LYPLLAIGALVAPIAGRAQLPQPRARELFAVPGVEVNTASLMPNGRVVLYSAGDSISAYDMTTRRTSLVTRGWEETLVVSPQGDRIAYSRRSEDGRTQFIWATPIDSRTGAATGPAQRVTTTQGRGPSFSPDGRLIAFGTIRAGGSDVAVVPATGGPERILATLDRMVVGTAWSVDARWIYLDVLERKGSLGPRGFMQYERLAVWARSAERVPAAGGASESLIRYSHPTGGNGEGQITGQIAFYRSDRNAIADGRVAYATASGVRGEIQVPPGAEPGFDIGPPGLLVRTTRRVAAHLLNVADGTVRDLLSGTQLSFLPVWSADGRWLALRDSSEGHRQITIMNADGSHLRRYPAAMTMLGGSMHWSPNGQLLAYYAGAGQPLVVLDPATGNSRVAFAAPEATFIDFTWRPDGRSIVLVRRSMNGLNEVHEAQLDGTNRKLRDIAAEFVYTMFISDQLILGGNPGTPSNRYALIPTSGGPEQYVPGGIGRRRWPGVSSDGKWLLFQLRGSTENAATSVELVTTGGDSSRTLSLPFEVALENPPFDLDGRHVILVGKVPGEDVFKIFLVPLNGDTPRTLATIPGTPRGRLDLSPDGGTLAFTTVGPPTSTIFQLDFGPMLAAVRR